MTKKLQDSSLGNGLGLRAGQIPQLLFKSSLISSLPWLVWPCWSPAMPHCPARYRLADRSSTSATQLLDMGGKVCWFEVTTQNLPLCPSCQLCHIKHISILVPSQMVVILPRKTPVLQDLGTHFRIYVQNPLPLVSVQDLTLFRSSTSLSLAWILRALFCFQIVAPATGLGKVACLQLSTKKLHHCYGTQKMAPPVYKAEQHWKEPGTVVSHQAKWLKEDLAGDRAVKSDLSQMQLSKKFFFSCKRHADWNCLPVTCHHPPPRQH